MYQHSIYCVMLVMGIQSTLGIHIAPAVEPHEPRHRTVELNIGECVSVQLVDNTMVHMKLVDLREARDSVRQAIREARLTLEIDGQPAIIQAANYRLPKLIGKVQVDCTATRGLNESVDGRDDPWGLRKDARIRLWPARSAWMPEGQIVYPLKQRWFASATQMGNEPSFVDGGDAPLKRKTYYHYGLDIGGCEGLTEVVAATDGVVVSAGLEKLPDVPSPPVAERYDVVYIRDQRNWYYRYSHLKLFDVRVGDKVSMGQKIGLVGKEGATAWSHLHFDIKAMQPSGKWGIEEGYAFLWETYQRQYRPKLIAVARPHHLCWPGEKVVLDGSRSCSATGKINHFEWTFTDGHKAAGERVEHTYREPGQYSEILKIIDTSGNIDYDFATVLVIDRKLVDQYSPTIHASYWPTFGNRVGQPVTIKVRSYFAEALGETWDFGDGTGPTLVRSDANANRHSPDGYAVTTHEFEKPGDYLVCVTHPGKGGAVMTTRLCVHIEP